MKIIDYNGSKTTLKKADIWFCDDFNNIQTNDYDEIHVFGYKDKINNKGNLQHTLVIDLEKQENELFDQIRKNVKYEINRCIKEKTNYKVMDSAYLKKNKDEIDQFEKLYNEMYREKNMNVKLPRTRVMNYINNDCFLLTKIVSSDTLGECYHAYIYDKSSTRLLYSCSAFRSQNKEEKNFIGRANKYLHWQDMLYFKEKKIKYYDFGGIFSFEKPNGIDTFKMSFGGEQKDYYNVVLCFSLKSKLITIIDKILRKLKK